MVEYIRNERRILDRLAADEGIAVLHFTFQVCVAWGRGGGDAVVGASSSMHEWGSSLQSIHLLVTAAAATMPHCRMPTRSTLGSSTAQTVRCGGVG